MKGLKLCQMSATQLTDFFFIIMLGMYNRNIANSYLALVAVLHKNWFEAFINT